MYYGRKNCAKSWCFFFAFVVAADGGLHLAIEYVLISDLTLHFTRDANWSPNHKSQKSLQIKSRMCVEPNTSSQRLATFWPDSIWLHQINKWSIKFHKHSRAKLKYL